MYFYWLWYMEILTRATIMGYVGMMPGYLTWR